MAYAKTTYEGNDHASPGFYKVTYLVNETNTRLTRSFDSEYLARKFVNKLKFSKRCTLLSCPLFS